MSHRLVLPLSLALLALPACQEEVDYGYFAVKVVVDPSADMDYLARIATCGVNVEGADVDFSSLACAEGRFTRHELGTFEWSTNTPRGAVQFIVTLKDGTWNVIGTGSSPSALIEPGRTVEATVMVMPTPGSLTPP